MAWQLGGDAVQLRMLADGADVLLLVECRTKDNEPVDVKKALGKGWRVWQDLSSASRSGSVIAVRKGGPCKAEKKLNRSTMQRIADGGPELQARYMRTLQVRDERGELTLIVGHMPKKDTGQQESALTRAHGGWSIIGGRKLGYFDVNSDIHRAADHIGAPNVSGNGVVCFMWSNGWNYIRARWSRVSNLDHMVGTITTIEEIHRAS